MEERRLGGGPPMAPLRAGTGLKGLVRVMGAGRGGQAGWGRTAGLAVGVGAAAAVLAAVALPRPLVRLAARYFRRKCIFEMPPRKDGEKKCASALPSELDAFPNPSLPPPASAPPPPPPPPPP